MTHTVFKRKGYTRQDGTKVSATIVTRRNGGTSIPKLKKGELTKYGYKLRVSPKERHDALKMAEAREGYKKIISRLNAIRTLTKNSQKNNSNLYNKDLHWLQAHK